MKIYRSIFFITLLIVTVLCVICMGVGYTFVIPISKSKQLSNPSLVKGSVINIFKQANLNKGHWTVYINFTRSDLVNLSPSINKVSCIKTSDIELIKEMKNKWNFVYQGADIATAESSIYVFNEGELFFESGIILEKDKQGLQSSLYGWMETTEPQALVETCKKFETVYWPILVL